MKLTRYRRCSFSQNAIKISTRLPRASTKRGSPINTVNQLLYCTYAQEVVGSHIYQLQVSYWNIYTSILIALIMPKMLYPFPKSIHITVRPHSAHRVPKTIHREYQVLSMNTITDWHYMVDGTRLKNALFRIILLLYLGKYCLKMNYIMSMFNTTSSL